MDSGGILKSGTIIREWNSEKNLVGISKGKIIKKLLDREKEKKSTLFEKKKEAAASTSFFYKQSIFDPRPENCLSFSKKSAQKIV